MNCQSHVKADEARILITFWCHVCRRRKLGKEQRGIVEFQFFYLLISALIIADNCYGHRIPNTNQLKQAVDCGADGFKW